MLSKLKTGLWKIILPVAVLTIVTGILFSAGKAAEENKIQSLSGTVSLKRDVYYLQAGKESRILVMIPPAAMDSMGFHPQAGDTLTVSGIDAKPAFICSSAVYKGEIYTFRTEDNQPAWKGFYSWLVNAKQCIGCRLCYSYCPVGAITMVKAKAVIDQSLCAGCNICIAGNNQNYRGCPVNAISK